MLSEFEVIEALQVALDEFHDWSIVNLLKEAQKDSRIWQNLCLEIDKDDPSSATDFLKGMIEIGDLLQFQGDAMFVALVALHNVCGCMEAVESKIKVPAPELAVYIPCTGCQFKIVKYRNSYKLVFDNAQCQFVSNLAKHES